MNADLNWLPDLVKLSDFNGDWDRYLAKLYGYFYQDFIVSRPRFRGEVCRIATRFESDGKETTFWHLISDGPVESDRLPDLRPCERIRWPRPIIDAASSNRVKWWRNNRGRERRFVLAVEDFSYVVVLAQRKGYVVLWTAYCVEHENRRRRLEEEYNTLKD